MSVRKSDLVKVFLNSKSNSDAIKESIALIQSRFNIVFDAQNRRKLYCSISRLKSTFIKLHDECCQRKTDRFYKHHKRWLEIDYKVPVTVNMVPTVSEPAVVHGGGRPRLPYEVQSERSRRRTINEASKVFDKNTNLALDTARYVAARNGDGKVVSALKTIKDTQNIENSKDQQCSMMTPDAALALLLECELTKAQYLKIRNAALAHGHKFLPSYDKVSDAKKACRPKNVSVDETQASVPLQNLVDHTITRIIQSQYEFIERQINSTNCQEINGKLIICWGFDGSSSQAQFNQRYSTANDHHESSLFVTSTLPLQLICDNGNILWANATPQSVKFCRPKSIVFEKESAELTRRTKEEFELEISNLIPTSCKIGAKTLTVKCDFFLTMLDGKCLMNISDVKSSSVCYICECPPSKMNNLQQARNFPINEDMLNKGFSVLHLWMRLLDVVTKISYKLPVKEKVRGEENKKIVAARKKEIQDRFWSELHLRLDLPRPSGGTSTTG